MIKPVPLVIKPHNAIGIAPAISSPDIVFLGPNLSHSGPMITRMAIVAATLAIPELAKSNFDRCNSLLIVGSNG
jgi:hypothetical protein